MGVAIRSLQKVQSHRTAQGNMAGVDVDVTPPTGGPVGHPPNPATLCDRSAQGSKSWHSGSFAKYSRHRPCHNVLPGVLCVAQGHRITSYFHDMHTRRRRPDYLQTCPCGWSQVRIDSGPVALCGPVALYLLQWPWPSAWELVHSISQKKSLLFHAGQAAIKPPSAEASKWAQCTSPGKYTPYVKGIVKTP